jgi:hypothetical protein
MRSLPEVVQFALIIFLVVAVLTACGGGQGSREEAEEAVTNLTGVRVSFTHDEGSRWLCNGGEAQNAFVAEVVCDGDRCVVDRIRAPYER